MTQLKYVNLLLPSIHRAHHYLHSHRLHKSTMEMHRYAKAARRSRFLNNSDTTARTSVIELEMDNFQEPQVCPILFETPLEPDALFDSWEASALW
jgi:hypothetical protein